MPNRYTLPLKTFFDQKYNTYKLLATYGGLYPIHNKLDLFRNFKNFSDNEWLLIDDESLVLYINEKSANVSRFEKLTKNDYDEDEFEIKGSVGWVLDAIRESHFFIPEHWYPNRMQLKDYGKKISADELKEIFKINNEKRKVLEAIHIETRKEIEKVLPEKNRDKFNPIHNIRLKPKNKSFLFKAIKCCLVNNWVELSDVNYELYSVQIKRSTEIAKEIMVKNPIIFECVEYINKIWKEVYFFSI